MVLDVSKELGCARILFNMQRFPREADLGVPQCTSSGTGKSREMALLLRPFHEPRTFHEFGSVLV